MTFEIEMDDEDFKTFSEYAAEHKNFNAETIAAMNDTLLIAEGKIPAKSFNNVQELMADLMTTH